MKGRAWILGDNIDTDQIYPGKYLPITDVEEMAEHALEGVDGFEDFNKKVKKGDVIVAGKNFGCGSSREHAPISLKYSSVGVVIAESFARIFYRNSINIGFPILECDKINEKVSDGDELKISLDTGKIENLTTGEIYEGKPLSGLELEIAEAGGLLEYLCLKPL